MSPPPVRPIGLPGFGNQTRREAARWWSTPRWWRQALVWTLLLGALLAGMKRYPRPCRV